MMFLECGFLGARNGEGKLKEIVSGIYVMEKWYESVRE